MNFAFADSPPTGRPGRGGASRGVDVTASREVLLLTAKGKTTTRLDAVGTAGESRLLEAVADEANLSRALLKVLRNKGAPGADGETVVQVEARASALLAALGRELLEGNYRPGAIRRAMIAKPGGGERPLGIPNVRDRVVQQALLQVLGPIFEPGFHPSSHGFRPGRGAPTAIAEVKGHLRAGHTVLVDLDISRFFDEVQHQRLLARLGRRVGGPACPGAGARDPAGEGPIAGRPPDRQ